MLDDAIHSCVSSLIWQEVHNLLFVLVLLLCVQTKKSDPAVTLPYSPPQVSQDDDEDDEEEEEQGGGETAARENGSANKPNQEESGEEEGLKRSSVGKVTTC